MQHLTPIIPIAALVRRAGAIASTARRALSRPRPQPPLSAQPIRGSLYSTAQLEQHARAIAPEHVVVRQPGSLRPLHRVLRRNEQALDEAYSVLAEDARARRPITPAAEWLLDNYHIVTDQIREIRQDLPSGYYEKLPKLASGPHRGLPRVYVIALELIEHTDGRIDLEQLIRFVLAYQSVTPLEMGELWALAIMLRLGLVDNLGRLASLTRDARMLRYEADMWAERLLSQTGVPATGDANPVLRELSRRHPQLLLPFAVQILRHLRSYEGDLDVAALMAWVERQPGIPYANADELIRAEHQRQAANQVSVANTITSMRTLNAIDWEDWFERVSLVEQVLRQDPGRAYARSTFATRDRYRHEVEELARGSRRSEDEVARRLVSLARRALAEGYAPRETHIGYYLVDEGRPLFEAELGYRAGPAELARRVVLRNPTAFYLGALGGATAAAIAVGMRVVTQWPRAAGDGRAPLPRSPLSQAAAAALMAIPASALATELVNRCVTQMLKPRVLPRLDLRDGIPAELRTIVVVPTLLLTPDSVRRQLDSLEVIFLANQDPHLHFAILSDFADAPEAQMPEDALLLQIAAERVAELNRRHGSDRFLMLHRRRVWNEKQGCWMGWERKRGKLEEFNRLLAGAADTTFDIQIGDLSVLPRVRYVITLDADTQLPRDAGQALIGTLAHPLNQAAIDPRTGRVVQGYGILQPRIGIDLPSATKSRFARIFTGNVGIDPYTTAVSDVYMDLFGEGIYAGKGIYDPAALRVALHNRFPENALLSHDLIEGNYARAALLSDVELLDSYPTTYAAYAARHHRWVRGDWQIARWLLPWVPSGSGELTRNVLPIMARYKIFDNLRRSLVPPASVALLLAGLRVLPGPPAAWAALALGHYAVPLAFDLLTIGDWRLLRGDQGALRNVLFQIAGLRMAALRLVTNLALLPDQAVLNIDAIARTLTRLLVTRRNLLEWETAAQSEYRLQSSAGIVARRTLPALMALAAALVGRAAGLPGAPRGQAAGSPYAVLTTAAPVAGLWAAAPALAAWLDKPWVSAAPLPLTEDDRALLRRIARATWAYFERFVVPEDHYLAPDNYQESPHPVVAHRTSPTNIGLQLVADLAAYDFGYIGLTELTERTERVLATIAQLEQFHGHLLNWYDTQTLRPLPPAYVSTVDSGNLAGALIALAHGYRALRDRPIVGPWVCDGLRDTLHHAERHLLESERAMQPQLAAIEALLAPPPTTVEGYRALLQAVRDRAAALTLHGPAGGWLQALRRQAEGFLQDLTLFLPDFAAGGEESEAPPTLGELAERESSVLEHGEIAVALEDRPDVLESAPAAPDGARPSLALQPSVSIQSSASGARLSAADLLARHAAIADTCAAIASDMDFSFLYNDKRRIFAIGYSVAESRLDNSFYDLLASEARLASFIAIAHGDVPQEHWFHIGRTITPASPIPTLISWSGTMFEYLMPLLLMRNFPETLFDSTYRGAVARQIAYGRERQIPWGISESAFNARDLSMNYQYRAFGVPGLGLKGGLAEDLVVAPYATTLALPIVPHEAVENLRALLDAGMEGAYGLYEAIDFTPERLPHGAKSAIVRCYMVHHQGMSLLALTNALHDNIMQKRFHAEPLVQATETLLQEKIPLSAPLRLPDQSAEAPVVTTAGGLTTRQFATANTALPYTHLLSNGSYSVMLTNAGGGASIYRGMAVTRWRPDATRDAWGAFCYIRDARSGAAWSAAHQPLRVSGQGYRVTYALEKVEYHQQVAGIDTRLEVTVSPEDDVEVRRVSLTNLTSEPRELEITSYAELVLAPASADAAHPAFSNLFVETEFLPERDALLASRRPRGPGAERPWAFHVVVVRGRTSGATQFDTDRATFVGRGRTPADPQALHEPLAGRAGAVLDPIFSLRRRVRIVPGSTVQLMFATGVAPSREQALLLADKYRDHLATARAFEMAWTQNQVELRHLGLTADEAHRFQRLATFALYCDPLRRAPADVLRRNMKGQPGLWAYGISGDFPIILARIGSGDEMGLVQELLRAYEYWRLKGLVLDLVFLNEEAGGYMQGLQDQLLSQIRSGRATAWLNQRGGVFVLRSDIMPEEDKILLQTVARVVLSGRRGDLAQHLRRREHDVAAFHAPPRPPAAPPALALVEAQPAAPRAPLLLEGAYGGFSPDGREFVIDVRPGQPTPAPWSNVVANERFGFVISERGAGYTWSENSRENRLTPWSNDPVSDPVGEAIYLRDEETGGFWSPTPAPAGGGPIRVRHGFGYSAFERGDGGLTSELYLFVPPEDSVKVAMLLLRNDGDRPRRLSATFYAEWVLGVFRDQMAPYVITDFDQATGTLLARNPYNHEFAERVAFMAAHTPEVAYTADRAEFIGRNGDLEHPAAMERRGDLKASLSRTVGPGLDPCGALRLAVNLAPGEERIVVFLLGQGDDQDEALALVARYREPEAARAAFERATGRWRELLDSVQVQTPQPELDVLLNGWLLYQTLACRVWGRSAFYQSGGAYGFRDQLQDVMALVFAAPHLTREHIVRAAGRQFVEGDVQHWWHPPTGRGIRTAFSDDYLWLPFVVCYYVAATGDAGVLDELAPFLRGRPLEPGEGEYYGHPEVASERGTIYEHCWRAIDYALGRMGQHDLPLMGAGDWNDGMNLVGHEGRGESVWVGWFLSLILAEFAEVAAARGDGTRAARYRAEARRLKAALEEHAWDGNWYLRAFYDDGTPLGSAQSDECRIDSLTQSWAVISGAGDPGRARQAMAAVDAELVDQQAGLIKLFAPPFDQTTHNPGYIKGYLPGVRENGGQYTHAAIWVIWAYTMLGEGQRAAELLSLINPVRHALADPQRYKVEPYVIAADVYAVPPHTGRGGWTWYTGSAGWLYRLGLEAVLGLRRAGDAITLAPCIPPAWEGYSITLRHGSSSYRITVENPDHVATGVAAVTLDGEALPDGRIPLRDDGADHEVRVVMGARRAGRAGRGQ